MVIVSLFPLSLSPCFYCTVLVPVHRVYTSCFHNAVGSSSYRLHTSCLHHTGATSCFSLNMWLQLISWNVSLVRSSWESAHIEFNLWSVYYDMLLYDGTCHFTMRDVVFSVNSYANCHHDIYQETFSTRHSFCM